MERVIYLIFRISFKFDKFKILDGAKLSLKRFFDFSVSFIGLLVLIPLFIVLGFAIKLNDKGPVFFRQKRVGRGGIVFYIYKFRTMRIFESTDDGLFRPENSFGVTPFGIFLRRTKLNELPQLVNVLKGEMSLVGPRPEVEKWVAVYPERWAKVLRVKPGITDKASIVYWNEEYILAGSADPEITYKDVVLPKKLDLYEDYVDNHSFSNDMRLIFTTLSVFLFRNNYSVNKSETEQIYLDKI